MKTLAFLTIAVLGLCTANGSLADDWPQWMGPNRDNHLPEMELATEFPEGGLPIKWRAPVANGYAGPAMALERVFLMDFVTEDDVKVSNFDRRPNQGTERVLCLSAETGKLLWTHEYPVTYAISYPAGPRCTPLVDEESVYALGAEGNLHCLSIENGEQRWSRDFKSDYGTKTALWGYANHPLIDGDKLLCIVGGNGSHAVAFNKHTGAELWRYGTASEQGYCPPKIIEAAGVRQLILMSPDFIASVNPETGEEYWTKNYQATNGSVIMTPVRSGKYLFVGGYSQRNLMLELHEDRPGATVLFQDKPKLGLSPVNVQPFVEKDMLYGFDGDGTLCASRIPSGERLWETGQPVAERPVRTGTAFLVRVDGGFYLFTESGELVSARLTPEGYEELDRTPLIEPTNNAFGRPVVWSAPAFADGCVFVRNDEECICVPLP